MRVLQAVPCSTELEVSWTSHCEQATLHYIDRHTTIIKYLAQQMVKFVHPCLEIVWIYLGQLFLTKKSSYAESAERITKLFYCLKEHHKLQYDECMQTKKNNAVVANVNHPTSTLTPTKARIYSTSASSSPRCTEINNTVLLAKDTCPVNKMSNEGFRKMVNLLGKRYVNPSCNYAHVTEET